MSWYEEARSAVKRLRYALKDITIYQRDINQIEGHFGTYVCMYVCMYVCVFHPRYYSHYGAKDVVWYDSKPSVGCLTFHAGSAIGSFFVFARFVFVLNLISVVAWLALVVLPMAAVFPYHTLSGTPLVRNLLDGAGIFQVLLDRRWWHSSCC